jgi:hypothetical protein
VQSKKAQRREAAKAKKERRELILEARALLKESTKADMKGDMEAAQRLRAKAANRQAGAASHHAPTTIPHSEAFTTNSTAHRGRAARRFGGHLTEPAEVHGELAFVGKPASSSELQEEVSHSTTTPPTDYLPHCLEHDAEGELVPWIKGPSGQGVHLPEHLDLSIRLVPLRLGIRANQSQAAGEASYYEGVLEAAFAQGACSTGPYGLHQP